MKDASNMLKAVVLYTIPVIQLEHISIDNTVMGQEMVYVLITMNIRAVQNWKLSLYGASSRGKSIIFNLFNE